MHDLFLLILDTKSSVIAFTRNACSTVHSKMNCSTHILFSSKGSSSFKLTSKTNRSYTAYSAPSPGTNDNAYRMTKIFYPKPDSNKAKKILKLNRGQLKKLIELVTGQNNLNYMNNKVYGSEDLCRFCEEEEETFDHIIATSMSI